MTQANKESKTEHQATVETMTNNVPSFSLTGNTIDWGIKSIQLTITKFPITDNWVLGLANKALPVEFRKVVDKNSKASAVDYLTALSDAIGDKGKVTYNIVYELDENGKETKNLLSAKVKISHETLIELLKPKTVRAVTIESTEKEIDKAIARALKAGLSVEDIIAKYTNQ